MARARSGSRLAATVAAAVELKTQPKRPRPQQLLLPFNSYSAYMPVTYACACASTRRAVRIADGEQPRATVPDRGDMDMEASAGTRSGHLHLCLRLVELRLRLRAWI